jgi:antitoxin component YwqK of YwqJK toxin-antitoxin module
VGESSNGVFDGAVRSYGTNNKLSGVAVYIDGREVASYDPTTNTFMGVNTEGVMSTRDVENFDKIYNALTEDGINFLGVQNNEAKYGMLVATITSLRDDGGSVSSIHQYTVDTGDLQFIDEELNPPPENGTNVSYDADGSVEKVTLYFEGVEVVSFNAESNSFTGINFHGMSSNDLESFKQIVDGMPDEYRQQFLENPSNSKYNTLNNELNLISEMGFSYDDVKNYDIDKPFDLNSLLDDIDPENNNIQSEGTTTNGTTTRGTTITADNIDEVIPLLPSDSELLPFLNDLSPDQYRTQWHKLPTEFKQEIKNKLEQYGWNLVEENLSGDGARGFTHVNSEGSVDHNGKPIVNSITKQISIDPTTGNLWILLHELDHARQFDTAARSAAMKAGTIDYVDAYKVTFFEGGSAGQYVDIRNIAWTEKDRMIAEVQAHANTSELLQDLILQQHQFVPSTQTQNTLDELKAFGVLQNLERDLLLNQISLDNYYSSYQKIEGGNSPFSQSIIDAYGSPEELYNNSSFDKRKLTIQQGPGLFGGGPITTTQTHHSNGQVATRTKTQNGVEIEYHEFDENGNQTLLRLTTQEEVNGQYVPKQPTTYTFPPGTEAIGDFTTGDSNNLPVVPSTARIESTTTYVNGTPTTKTDYVYGTEELAPDAKLPAGNYTEITTSTYNAETDQFVKTETVLTNNEDSSKPVFQQFYDDQGNRIRSIQTDYDSTGNKTSIEMKDYDASGNPTGSVKQSFDANGNITLTENFDANGNRTTIVSQDFDESGQLIHSSAHTFDANNNKTSSILTTYGNDGVESTTEHYFTYDANNKLTYETVIANGSETMHQYDANQVIIASGASSNGQWNGAVRFMDANGELTRVAVYANGVEGASYDAKSHTFSGINFDGVMTTQDLENFDKIVNSMREGNFNSFFEQADYVTKYQSLVDTLDGIQAVGLKISAIENFDLTKPQEFTLNIDALKAWDAELSKLDSDTLTPKAKKAIQDFGKYLDIAKANGARVSGVRTIGWVITQVLGGGLSDAASLGQDFYKFMQNMPNSKVFGKTASQLAPDFLDNAVKTIGGGSLKSASLLRFAGPVATLVLLGAQLAMGIIGFKEAQARGAGLAELSYWANSAAGFSLGMAFSAAFDATAKGFDAGVATGAFFKGLLGIYDPNNPAAGLADQYWGQVEDNQTRQNSLNSLRKLNIPANPATGDPGFNGEEVYQKLVNSEAGWDYDPNYYSWKFEDAYYDYMEQHHSDSPNYVPRIEGVNGEYVSNSGEKEWQWAPGQMPIWGIKEGASGANIDDLYIQKMTDQVRPDIGEDNMDDSF